MRQIIRPFLIVVAFTACNSRPQTDATTPGNAPRDTLVYEYKALYSSDITVPGNPLNAQTVNWKVKDGKVVAFDQYTAKK